MCCRDIYIYVYVGGSVMCCINKGKKDFTDFPNVISEIEKGMWQNRYILAKRSILKFFHCVPVPSVLCFT